MNQSINYLRIEKAINYLKKNYQSQPPLDEIAQYVHLSKFHFQRLFENWAGVSPKSFVQFLTVKYAKHLLDKGQSTLDASYDAGLSGTGRLHDLFVKIESVSPGQYKTKGIGVCISYGFYNTNFGNVLIAETQKGICHLGFVDDKQKAISYLGSQWKNADLVKKKGRQAVLVQDFLNQHIVPEKKILLDIKGTDFQIKVWEALLKIPKGQLLSYGNVAQMIGKPKAARAVGTAIARNPIAYIIPCHRVIRETGEIGQYRWGGIRKSTIIGWEAAQSAKEAYE